MCTRRRFLSCTICYTPAPFVESVESLWRNSPVTEELMPGFQVVQFQPRMMQTLLNKTHEHYKFGDGSKPWYLVNPKIAGKWMFIPLKMYL